MEQKEVTIIGNKLIAEFMGVDFYDMFFNSSLHDSSYTRDNYMLFIGFIAKYHGEDFKYNSSWDWLMPVLVKIGKIRIENIPVDYTISSSNCGIWGGFKFTYSDNSEDLLNIMWNAVVYFINWYNKSYNTLPKVGEVAIDEDGEEYIVKPANSTCHAFFHSECVNKNIECYRCDEFYLKDNNNE